MIPPNIVANAGSLAVLLMLAGSAASAGQPNPSINQVFAFACDPNTGICPNGESPNSLIQSADGNFYGTTQLGGMGNSAAGTVFRLTPDGQFTTVYTFVADQSGNFPNGNSPSSILEGNDGSFYGTTTGGGANNGGTVFRLSKSGDIQVLHSFCSLADCADTPLPSGLVLGNDGRFYGGSGGSGLTGELFRITAQGAFKILHAFDLLNEGPASLGMTLASDGNFYGTTIGAETVKTVLFRLTTSGRFQSLHTFHYAQFPDSPPTQGLNGKLYGAMSRYEDQSAPGMFQTGLSGKKIVQYQLQYEFGDNMNHLTAMSDGSLWGSITAGSDFPNGVLLAYSAKGKPLQSIPFDGANGAAPNAPLLESSDGMILGVTASGGTVGGGDTPGGVIFALNTGLAPPAPSIASFAPSSGAVGTQVTIHGTHLLGTTAVAFDGVDAAFQVLNTGNLLATVPQGATTGPVTITNAGGTATSTENFTVE